MSVVLAASIAAMVLGAFAERGHGQLAIDNLSSTFTIDFDTSVAGANSGTFTGTGFQPAPTVGQLDSDAWAVTGFSDGNLAFGGTFTTGDYARGSSVDNVTTGGLYAFTGGSIIGSAIGIQPIAADFNPGTLTLRIQNATATPIVGFTLSYEIHVRNDQGRSSSFNFSDSADNTVYNAQPTLDFTSLVAADPSPTFVLNTRSITLNSVTIPAGGFYYLRWSSADVGGAGSRDELALDNITLSSFGGGAPTLFWDANGGPGVGGTGFWDTGTPNWNSLSDGSGATQTFTSANAAVFGGTAGIKFETTGYLVKSDSAADKLTLGTNNTITVNGSAEISAGIDGTSGLTKTGPATLTLSGANGFTGNVTVSAGTLAIAADTALGNTNNDVVLAGGTLKAIGVVVLDSGRDFSGSGTIDLSGSAALQIAHTANFGTLTFAGDGAFLSTGSVFTANALNFSGPVSVFSPISLGGDLATTHTSGTATILANVDYGAIGGATRNVTVSDGTGTPDFTISGNITGSGTTGKLVKLGGGTLRLEGNNSGFLGIRLGIADALAPTNGGTLEVTNKNALGTTELQLNAGTLKFSGPLTGADAFPAGVNLSIGAQESLPVRFTGNGAEFLGDISLFKPTGANFRHQINVETSTDLIIDGSFVASTGTGISTGLNFAGNGTIIFNGATNAVAEPFFINGPTVELNGSFANVDATVNAGILTFTDLSTLKDVVIGDGSGDDAGLFPSDTVISTLTVSSLSLLSDATVGLDFDTSTQTTDHVVVNSGLTLGSGVAFLDVIDLAPTLLPLGTPFTLIDAGVGATVSGFFEGYPEGFVVELAPNFFRISYAGGLDGHDVTLTTVVPEPGAGALALAGFVGVLGLRRRRTV